MHWEEAWTHSSGLFPELSLIHLYLVSCQIKCRFCLFPLFSCCHQLGAGPHSFCSLFLTGHSTSFLSAGLPKPSKCSPHYQRSTTWIISLPPQKLSVSSQYFLDEMQHASSWHLGQIYISNLHSHWSPTIYSQQKWNCSHLAFPILCLQVIISIVPPKMLSQFAKFLPIL